jgi:hypothetical protein
MQCVRACVHVDVRGRHALQDLFGVRFRVHTREWWGRRERERERERVAGREGERRRHAEILLDECNKFAAEPLQDYTSYYLCPRTPKSLLHTIYAHEQQVFYTRIARSYFFLSRIARSYFFPHNSAVALGVHLSVHCVNFEEQTFLRCPRTLSHVTNTRTFTNSNETSWRPHERGRT